MLNGKMLRVLNAKTTRFAARKASSFLYFAYDRDTSTLAGYTKTGTLLKAVVSSRVLRYFLSEPFSLRGQAFGKIAKSYSRSLAVHKLTSSEYADALAKVKREVVLPARKNCHFQDFKVRALKSGAEFTVTGLLKGRSKTELYVVLDREQMAKFAATPLSQRSKAFTALVFQSNG